MTQSERIFKLQTLIQTLEVASNRQPGSVTLLAVSKGHSWQAIEDAYQSGLRYFGENYLQEALVKMQALSSYPIHWHFIGAIQSNKTSEIAQHFSWAHGVCRKKIAHLLNQYRPKSLSPLNVCIQVNIDNEPTKSGISPDKAAELAADIVSMPNLKLRGLMVIPKEALDETQQLQSFMRTALLLDEINHQCHLKMDTLSMGMSDDLKPAILAGSTIVRVGRAIFGKRG